jgi:hypothetical protein
LDNLIDLENVVMFSMVLADSLHSLALVIMTAGKAMSDAVTEKPVARATNAEVPDPHMGS